MIEKVALSLSLRAENSLRPSSRLKPEERLLASILCRNLIDYADFKTRGRPTLAPDEEPFTFEEVDEWFFEDADTFGSLTYICQHLYPAYWHSVRRQIREFITHGNFRKLYAADGRSVGRKQVTLT